MNFTNMSHVVLERKVPTNAMKNPPVIGAEVSISCASAKKRLEGNFFHPVYMVAYM